jgi:hypothetical protein
MQRAHVDAGDAERVDDNIGGAVVLLGDVEPELHDGDSSSDAGYQGVDDGRDEVLGPRRRHGEDGVRNLLQRRVRARLN